MGPPTAVTLFLGVSTHVMLSLVRGPEGPFHFVVKEGSRAFSLAWDKWSQWRCLWKPLWPVMGLGSGQRCWLSVGTPGLKEELASSFQSLPSKINNTLLHFLGSSEHNVAGSIYWIRHSGTVFLDSQWEGFFCRWAKVLVNTQAVLGTANLDSSRKSWDPGKGVASGSPCFTSHP